MTASPAPPAPRQAQIDGDSRNLGQRQHDAFVAIGRNALASGELGQHNGLPVTVIVSTTVQDLEKAAGPAVSTGPEVTTESEVTTEPQVTTEPEVSTDLK